MEVTASDVESVFPRPLLDEERERMSALISQSLELITLEFARRGRDFAAELQHVPWLPMAVRQAVRIMVSQAVLVGENVGRMSVASTTGQESDSITFSQGIGFHWGGVGIDDAVLELLGLHGWTRPRGRGGRVIPFGSRERWFGAEFSERPGGA
ncbi:Gp19/Gp15/Gp42 family protein [Corynebacterium ulceribovis]|uniref:Gp19/Gp15/Gp42 family protein n=1 Tax=Corynebacterium ulceribovis TaxID=487732 RepID=UPI0003637DE9|nr:Gp19/Gp15/Gp42 family protein [Corynebacterium ulceribovis]